MTDKWGRRPFKTGAAAMLLLACVHAISLFEKPTPANDTEKQLLDLMANYKFNLMGSLRSMWELMRGFSVAFTLWALGLGILDLAFSNECTALLKRLAFLNVLWLAAITAVSLRYFFAAPTSFLVAALLIFTAALLVLPADTTA